MSGDEEAEVVVVVVVVGFMEARMCGTGERRSRAKCGGGEVAVEALLRGWAVVSQRLGSWGVVGVGRWGVDVGMGIWRERVRVGGREMCAMREVEMEV